ncbi:MAG: restriction endonuclease subunit R [Cyanobacteriota bacterium]|nr:restriction endonuclease subunit R [Cyanobacteriota bacterium]
MTQTLQAKEVTLYQLETYFRLQRIEDEQFFREWQDELPELTEAERQRLDRVRTSYFNLLRFPPFLENTVKMVVLSPLLDLADFYLPLFHITPEKSIEIIDDEEGVKVTGKLDVLTLFDRFWVTVIESKKAAFSLEVGRAQILFYMLASPNSDRPIFGLITNGGSFRFLKLIKGEIPQYSVSRIFDLLNPGNDLYWVLSILKRLGQLAIED